MEKTDNLAHLAALVVVVPKALKDKEIGKSEFNNKESSQELLRGNKSIVPTARLRKRKYPMPLSPQF